MTNSKNLSIKAWAEEDRPREKLILKGKSALSDAELIAILIGSGTRTLTAVELSKHILSKCNNDLNQLARFTLKDLMKFNGIGEAKAISILSALELGRRRKTQDKVEHVKIHSAESVYEYMKPHLMDLPHEEFWIIHLNRSNTIIKAEPVSIGGVSGTVVDPKIIFKRALEETSSYLVLIHNHPSGNLNPSKQDYHITQKLKQAGDTLDIRILDHVIFTDDGYFSFSENGRL
ncbi:RadC family protein [Reichenbachiella versicolor]|uniref:RadC family protein n=1 Tax=Reichenbachiella versicolor TaxID=1821036 RepID=UPI000D6E49CD|nr:DNA repair protein RadC [Reichenbachiella versicolor]